MAKTQHACMQSCNFCIIKSCPQGALDIAELISAKRLRRLNYIFTMPDARLPKRILEESWGFAHLVALGLVSVVLYYVTVKTVILIGHIRVHRTDLHWRDKTCPACT